MTKLFENEMDQAEVILAAKSVLDDLQDMAEKLAKTEAEGIMPLLDNIRTLFGPEYAEQLSSDSQTSLRAALDAVQLAKEQIGSNVTNMEQIITGEGPGNDMAQNLGVPDDQEVKVSSEKEPESEVSDQDIEDVFGDGEPSVGRETKESVKFDPAKILRESKDPDQLLIIETLKRVKIGMSAMEAISETADLYGIDVDDLVEIAKERFKKKA